MQYFENLPIYEAPREFKNSIEYFKHIVNEGLSERYSKEKEAKGEAWEVIMQRADYEMDVIINHNFMNYFFIVFDYVDWAKKQSILFAPGRGSSVGSIVAYALKITDIDPLQYNLLFENFINPEMLNPPDIYVDIDHEEREKVIEYIKEKYGQEQVGQSLTFNDKNKTFYTNSVSIVICKSPLHEFLPIIKDTKTGIFVVFCNRDEIKECGLAIFDIIPSKILAIIKHTVEQIKILGGNYADFCIEDIPNDDLLTYKLFKEGKTDNVFQFWGDKMKEFCLCAKPEKFTDLIALNALYHPDSLIQIDTFIENKNNINNIVYPDPSLEGVLKETYGILVYQEQVMQIACIIAGYSMNQADLFRRAISKMEIEIIEKERTSFIEGAVKRGFSDKKAGEIYDILAHFASYCFNKSHAVAYAKLAYQTAYLKANFPDQYKNTCCKYGGIYGIIEK